jgi:hypothetical protein
VTGAAIEDESAIGIGRNWREIGQVGVRLDWDRIVSCLRGGVLRHGRPAWPQNGIADQPIKLDRGVSLRSDHPPDRIPAGTWCGRNGFGRQTSSVAILQGAVGDEDNFLEHRSVNVEVDLWADKATV